VGVIIALGNIIWGEGGIVVQLVLWMHKCGMRSLNGWDGMRWDEPHEFFFLFKKIYF